MFKYKHILLDWGGNLAKTLDIWLYACRTTLEKRALSLTDQEVAASFGALPSHLLDWRVKDPDDVLIEASNLAKQKLPDVELYPDALIVLEKLFDSGRHLAIITTSPHENIKHLLDKLDITKFFEAIIAGDDVVNHKLHFEPQEKAMTQMRGNKNHAVMIGDSDKDIGAANNYGIDSILLYPNEHKKYYDLNKIKRQNPTYIVSDFKEILDIV